VIRSAAFLGEAPQGTMPHASSSCSGNGDGDARLRRGGGTRRFHGSVSSTRSRTRSFEAVRVAEGAAGTAFRGPARHAAGRVAATSADPSGKCGGSSIFAIPHVRLIASGGLGEEEVSALRDVVDGSRRDLPEQRPHHRLRARHRWKWRASRSRAGEAVRPQAGACLRACGSRTVRPARSQRSLALRRRPGAAPASGRCAPDVRWSLLRLPG